MTWWERLDQALSEKGWSRAELARRSGVSHDSIRKYLSGAVDKPRGDTVRLMCNTLGVSEQWVLFGTPAGLLEGKPPMVSLDALTTADGTGEPASNPSLPPEFRAIMPDAAMAPLIPLGAEVLCRATDRATPGQIVIALLKGRSTAQILRYRETHVTAQSTEVALTPENPAFPEYRFSKDEGYTIVALVTHVTVPL